MKVIELGCPGHLIVSNRCRWKRHTQIGTSFRVSSIGEYYPADGKIRETIGGGPEDWFETMVFETTQDAVPGSDGCGCLQVRSYCEIDAKRYRSAGEAQSGHERFVKKYAAKAKAL